MDEILHRANVFRNSVDSNQINDIMIKYEVDQLQQQFFIAGYIMNVTAHIIRKVSLVSELTCEL